MRETQDRGDHGEVPLRGLQAGRQVAVQAESGMDQWQVVSGRQVCRGRQCYAGR